MVPFLGNLNTRYRIIIGIQKRTIILKTNIGIVFPYSLLRASRLHAHEAMLGPRRLGFKRSLRHTSTCVSML